MTRNLAGRFPVHERTRACAVPGRVHHNDPMDDPQRVAAVILAAGTSERFGAPKQLARVGGRTMLEAACDLARGVGLAPVIVVLPPGIPVTAGVVPILNDRPELGMSHSLRLGLAAVPPESEGAVILLADQPTMAAATVRGVLAAERGGRPIVASRAEGRIAPPVLVLRSAFAIADEVGGDQGLARLLEARPELVTHVDVGLHAPDVDTPADLEALVDPCAGCGARFPPVATDETHAYIGASPACWAAFGELLAREFGDPSYGWIHRHTVDVYTLQHPGTDDRRQRQSVALHLIGLCQWLEHGMDQRRLNATTQRLASANRDWPWLTPPATYELTVQDALAATTAAEHGTIVRRWAEAVWEAWSDHHELVRRWATEALD